MCSKLLRVANSVCLCTSADETKSGLVEGKGVFVQKQGNVQGKVQANKIEKSRTAKERVRSKQMEGTLAVLSR